MSSSSGPLDDGSVLKDRNFLAYWITILFTALSTQIQTVAVSWQIFEITRNPIDLGLIGLTQFMPSLLLVLVTGSVLDRFSRKRIIQLCLVAEIVSAVGFFTLTLSGIENVAVFYLFLVILGSARAFYNPARQAFVPNLVADTQVPGAIAMSTTGYQFATIAGPVAGGLLFGLLPPLAYGTAILLLVAAMMLLLFVRRSRQVLVVTKTSWNTLLAGFRFIWSDRILVGAISMDLMAVLLGGAVALLPIYAMEILVTGPGGLGLLKAAPAIGGIAMGVTLMAYPIRKHAGLKMFAAVFLFGLMTIVFAYSRSLLVSVVALATLGACDMISVFVRNTLSQLRTPDTLRGRVTAVSQLFIGASNEIGAFRAGTMASFIGAVPAVAIGGAGAMIVSVIWFRLFPDLRRIQSLARMAGPAQ